MQGDNWILSRVFWLVDEELALDEKVFEIVRLVLGANDEWPRSSISKVHPQFLYRKTNVHPFRFPEVIFILTISQLLDQFKTEIAVKRSN